MKKLKSAQGRHRKKSLLKNGGKRGEKGLSGFEEVWCQTVRDKIFIQTAIGKEKGEGGGSHRLQQRKVRTGEGPHHPIRRGRKADFQGCKNILVIKKKERGFLPRRGKGMKRQSERPPHLTEKGEELV